MLSCYLNLKGFVTTVQAGAFYSLILFLGYRVPIHIAHAVVPTLKMFLQQCSRCDQKMVTQIYLVGFCLFFKFFLGEDIAELMMDFVEWLTNQEFGRQCILSVRDILAWVNFMNVMADDESSSAKGCSHLNISPGMSFIHAACLVYIDGIGSGKSSGII